MKNMETEPTIEMELDTATGAYAPSPSIIDLIATLNLTADDMLDNLGHPPLAPFDPNRNGN